VKGQLCDHATERIELCGGFSSQQDFIASVVALLSQAQRVCCAAIRRIALASVAVGLLQATHDQPLERGGTTMCSGRRVCDRAQSGAIHSTSSSNPDGSTEQFGGTARVAGQIISGNRYWLHLGADAEWLVRPPHNLVDNSFTLRLSDRPNSASTRLDYLHGNIVKQINPTNAGDAGAKFDPVAGRLLKEG